MTQPILPSIHLNGTSPQALADDAREAYGALRKAMTAMAAAAPNARDYYPQGTNAPRAAVDEFTRHIVAVQLATAHFEAHYQHAQDAADRKRGIVRVREEGPKPLGEFFDTPEQGFVNCPTCNRFTASVRGSACGDCHHKPVVVTVDYAGHTFEAKLTLADDRVVLNRDGHFGARGRWDGHHSRIEDCPGQLHHDETISEAVYDLLESRLKDAVATRRS